MCFETSPGTCTTESPLSLHFVLPSQVNRDSRVKRYKRPIPTKPVFINSLSALRFNDKGPKPNNSVTVYFQEDRDTSLQKHSKYLSSWYVSIKCLDIYLYKSVYFTKTKRITTDLYRVICTIHPFMPSPILILLVTFSALSFPYHCRYFGVK